MKSNRFRFIVFILAVFALFLLLSPTAYSGKNKGPLIVKGTQGPDTITLSKPRQEKLIGGWGPDQLKTVQGGDILLGGRLNDFIDGGPKADQLNGGKEDDVIYARRTQGDLIKDGPGQDYTYLGDAMYDNPQKNGYHQVIDGEGDDYWSAEASYFKYKDGQGNDFFKTGWLGGGVVDLNSGNNTVEVNYNFDGAIKDGSGNDTFNFKEGFQSMNSALQLEQGQNYVNIHVGQVTVEGGAGVDNIRAFSLLAGAQVQVKNAQGADSVGGGKLADSYQAKLGANTSGAEVDLDEGEDSYQVNSGTSVYAKDGQVDTITCQSGANLNNVQLQVDNIDVVNCN